MFCSILDTVTKKVTLKDIKKISGSFFDKIPSQSEVIILSRVLHDWNNEKAGIILKNCYDALPIGGTIYN